MISLKSESELGLMRKAGAIVAEILGGLEEMIKPGITTADIDKMAVLRCKDLNVIPAFKGYRGFPASVCVSLNSEVVHGIPNQNRVIKNGDLVKLDFGVNYEGWFGDAATTVAVGSISTEAKKLIDVTRASLDRAVEQCQEGKRLFDVSYAVQNYVEGFGYNVVRQFVGHGIGRSLHEEPQVPNYGPPGKGIVLKAGMVLAIEPMVNIGSHEVEILSDGWTAVTADDSLSAHFEHTVAVTRNGPKILTAPGTGGN